jgi:hypothetical protein
MFRFFPKAVLSCWYSSIRAWHLIHDRQPSKQSQAPSKLGILGGLAAKNAKLTPNPEGTL